MKIRRNQSGFASWELALGVVVIALIAFAGYHVYSTRTATTTPQTAKAAATKPAAPPPVTTPPAPTINSAADLNAALNVLDQTNPATSNGSDSNALSSQANF